jgi:hypothetical protein
MDNLFTPLFLLLRVHANQLRTAVRSRRSAGDAGVSTLEMVIIALGLMAVAGLLVAALTVAVTNRTNQIK